QQHRVPGLGLAPSLTSALFAAKAGDVTGALEVPRGWAGAFLKTVHPPHTAELAEVSTKVRQTLFNQMQEDKAIERLNAARKELDSGKTLDQVAAELGVPAKESAEFGANGSIPGLGASPTAAKLALTLQPGQFGGPVGTPNGALLFQVIDRKSWDPAKFAAARDQTRQSLQQQRLGSIITSLVARRRRELGVEYNPAVLQPLGVNFEGTAQAPPQAR